MKNYLLLFILCSFSITVSAEGTKELAPNDSIQVNGVPTTDVAALHINNDRYASFAHIGNDDTTSQLYINIQDPSQECIYLGFSVGHINRSNPNPPLLNFSFVIKDPNGNIVYGPQQVSPGNANINNWSEAFNGPQPIAGSNGYVPIIIDNMDLQSQGWSGSGNYYIQFDAGTNGNGFLIDFWDITVVNCQTTFPTAESGRIWSYNWSLFAINDYGFPNRPFNGSFYVCAPDGDNHPESFITQIDFNGSGFKPAAFNIAFNSFGTRNTGNIETDRKSVRDANLTTPEYAIYLNDPVDLCVTAEVGTIDFASIKRCSTSVICINVIPSKSGQIEVLLDLDGDDGVYTEDTKDVLLTYDVPDSLVGTEICISWDGNDGNGNPVTRLELPIVLNFNQGIYHFPIYDAELMESGVTINRIRPSGPSPLLYYDDSNIISSSGSGEPKVNLSGCTLPCHAWTNYQGSNVIGFGNLNTINSWWFSSTSQEAFKITMPNELVCNLSEPDSLCTGDIDTIYATVDTLGPDGITEFSYEWTGPYLNETTSDYAIISGPGTFTYTITYVNSAGEECSTDCTVDIAQGADCCEIELACPSDNKTISAECTADINPPLESIDDFLDAGFDLGDTTCLNLVSTMEESTNEGSGCLNDPLFIRRNYTLFHDANNNKVLDNNELSINCEHSFEVIDTVAPEVEFDNPMLDDLESGDTMQLQCRAGEEGWMIPEMSEDDIKVTGNCVDVDIEFTDEKLEDGNCSQDGFLSRYKCQWVVSDQCGNTDNIYFILEMVDTIAPTFTAEPRDTTIFCSTDINIPPPAHDEECCCSDIRYSDQVEDCTDGNLRIHRTWTVEDQCGNSSQLTETITVKDTTAPEIHFRNGDLSDGNRISVECVRGGFPVDIDQWDVHTVVVTDACNQNIDVTFDREFIIGGDCNTQALEQWKFIWTATDGCGNKATFTIYVDITDNTPPEIISIPEDDCDGFPPVDKYTAMDNCGIPDVTVDVQDVTDSHCPEASKKRYTYTATDRCGNSSQISKVYTKNDNTAPIIRLKDFNPGSNGMITIDCGTDKNINNLYSEEAISVVSECSETGSKQFKVVSSDAGNCEDGIYQKDVLQWDVYDICGNHAQLIVDVEYRDTEAPIINNFRDTIHRTCAADIPYYTAFTDCNSTVVTYDELDFTDDCTSEVVAERTIVVTDDCNNSREYTQWVIIDRTSSIERLNAEPIICESESDKTPVLHDLCRDTVIEAVLIDTYQPQQCTDYFSEIHEWKLTNTCGTSEFFKQKVLVDNPPAPDITITHPVLGDITEENSIQLNCLDPGLSDDNFSFTDQCGIYSSSLKSVQTQDSCVNNIARTIDYTYELTDACGNVYTEQIQVEYIDETPPQFTRIPEDMTISCADSLVAPEVTAADNCSNVNLQFNEIPFTPTGEPGFSRTWIATDACGNRNTALQVFTVESELDCEIEVPEDIDCWSTTELEVHVTGGNEPYIYDWESVNGECIIHHETDEPTANVTILSDSVEVKVIVTDSQGCMTECRTVINCVPKNKRNVLMRMKSDDAAIMMYPNPSEDMLYFSSDNEIVEVVIYNLNGDKQLRLSPDQKNVKMPHTLKPGLHLVKIYTANTVEIKKLIVQ